MFTDEILKISSEFFLHCKSVDQRYKVISKLGEGRFGKVYLCFDDWNSCLVALKCLKK